MKYRDNWVGNGYINNPLGRGKGLANLPGEVKKIKGAVLDLSAGDHMSTLGIIH